MKSYIHSSIIKHLENAQDIARIIHENPEICDQEHRACELLGSWLANEGFNVTYNAANHHTAFDARYEATNKGPTLVFLAEYDALPGLGHACGHNLFGATSCLAAIALKQIVDQTGGSIRVYGTPGEEGGTNGSSKESFVREGYFDDVDAALCVHPGHHHATTVETLANDPVDIEFYGRASHAAAAPEHGINALDAVIQVFNSINAYRQHLPNGVLIHGIIVDGGVAANIIPDYAKARFYIRARTRKKLKEITKKVELIAQGAALATGCRMKFGLFQNKVDDTIITPQFDSLYMKQLLALGIQPVPANGSVFGSSDVGNVSYKVPTIQPTISISDVPIIPHTPEFCEAAISKKGLESIGVGASLLACTALDLYTSPEILKNIKEEHTLKVKGALHD